MSKIKVSLTYPPLWQFFFQTFSGFLKEFGKKKVVYVETFFEGIWIYHQKSPENQFEKLTSHCDRSKEEVKTD